MNITPRRRTALVRLSDQEWHYLRDVAVSTMASLCYAGLIRCDDESAQMIERLWMITPSGIAALDAAQ